MPNSGSSDKIVIDTYAWIEYFKGSDEGIKAKKIIEGEFELFTPSIVIAELSDKYRRENLSDKWVTRIQFVKLCTKILVLDADVSDKAGELKQNLKKNYKDVGLADAIVLAHSLNIDADILTGDRHLKNLKNAIDITK